MGEEAAKLACIRTVALPAGLFDGVPSRVLLAYRRRVGAEELHELRRHPEPIALADITLFHYKNAWATSAGLHYQARPDDVTLATSTTP